MLNHISIVRELTLLVYKLYLTKRLDKICNYNTETKLDTFML